jgi:hypothetical protein
MPTEVSRAVRIADPACPWSPYSVRTNAYKTCVGCGVWTQVRVTVRRDHLDRHGVITKIGAR